jgi:hypothetical protein
MIQARQGTGSPARHGDVPSACQRPAGATPAVAPRPRANGHDDGSTLPVPGAAGRSAMASCLAKQGYYKGYYR